MFDDNDKNKIEKYIKAFNCVMSLIIVHEIPPKNKTELNWFLSLLLKMGVFKIKFTSHVDIAP